MILTGIFLLLMVTSVESPTDRSSMALPIGLNIVKPLMSLRPQKSSTSVKLLGMHIVLYSVAKVESQPFIGG